MTYELFSVDDHVVEHATVWTSRLPGKFKERGPRVVREGGREHWLIEDSVVPTMGLNANAGKPLEEWKNEPTSFTDMIEGCYNPTQRAKDMAADGIIGSLCFPSLPRFAGIRFLHMKDKELASLCTQAYNDFMIEEWCAAAPELFVPMIIGQVWDIPAMVAEIHRGADRGARALSFPEFMGPLGLPSFNTDHWDPVFRALVDRNMALCMHIGTSGVGGPGTAMSYMPSDDSSFITEIILSPVINAQRSMIAVLCSPMLRKFPELKVVSSEGGVGWIPNLLERADRMWEKDRYWADIGDTPPSELYRQSFWVCFVDEVIALQNLRHEVGVDRMLWECDYPHSETPWPNSQAAVAKMMQGIPESEVKGMLADNARRLFNWPARA